ALQHRFDLFQQALGQARLGDERVAAGIHRALGVAGERVAREGDDRDGPGAIVGLGPRRRLPAVEAGQREDQGEPLGGVRGRLHVSSPTPAPMYSRVGELSAWRKSSKIRSRSSAEMPMPVSATAIAIWSPSGIDPARTSTDPRGVNLMALVRKLMTICLTFCRSVLSCGTSAASWLVTARCERAMIGSTSASTSATRSLRSNVVSVSGILPASSREMSRMSLMM